MTFENWVDREITQVSLDLKLRRPAPHQSIFKYVGLNTKTSWDHLTRTLETGELVGSTFNALNDPFELSPYLFDDLRPSAVAKALGMGPSLADNLKGRNWNAMDAVGDLAKHVEDAKKAFAKIQSNARIIAFCERSDSPLLWSHYANSYQGACLHFLGGAFARDTFIIGAVSYSSNRPTYPLSLALRLASPSRHLDDLARAESDKMVFFTKASDWAYEREVRIVYDIARRSAVQFKPDGLASIIIGPRMPPANVERLQDLVRRSGVPNLPIRRAQLSNNSFSVEIE